MIGLRTKRVEEFHSQPSEEVIQYLKLAIRSLRSKEINKPTKMEALRLLESLKIDIQARQV